MTSFVINYANPNLIASHETPYAFKLESPKAANPHVFNKTLGPFTKYLEILKLYKCQNFEPYQPT